MFVLFLGGVESTAGLRRTVFSCSPRTRTNARLLRANPSLIPDAVEEAHPHRDAAAAGRPHHARARSPARHDDPRRGARVPGLRLGQPRRAPVRRTRPLRRAPAASSGTSFGEGMHGCLGAPLARLEAKMALEDALPRPGRLHDHRRARALQDHARTCACWEHLHLAFPVTEAAPRPAAASRRRPPHRHHRGRPTSSRPRSGVAAKDERAEGVVALTLRDADGAPLPAVGAGRARRPRPGGGAPNRQYSLCGDPADRTVPTASACCATPDGGGGSRARPRPRCDRGRRRAGARPAQQLPARALAALPVHRGRHRHHADPADDRRGRGGGRRVAAGLRRAARGRRWRSSTSWRLRRPRVAVRPQDETGCSTSRPCSAAPSPTPSSTAAGRSRCSPPSRNGARAGRRARCTWSGSRPKPVGAPVRAEAFEVELARSGLDPDRAAGPLDPRRRRGGRGRRAVLVRRGHLRHLRDRRARRASPTTATPCSPTRSRRRTTA